MYQLIKPKHIFGLVAVALLKSKKIFRLGQLNSLPLGEKQIDPNGRKLSRTMPQHKNRMIKTEREKRTDVGLGQFLKLYYVCLMAPRESYSQQSRNRTVWYIMHLRSCPHVGNQSKACEPNTANTFLRISYTWFWFWFRF